MTTETEIHDALCRLETSINAALRHTSRAIEGDPTNDRLRELGECLAVAKRSFDVSHSDPARP